MLHLKQLGVALSWVSIVLVLAACATPSVPSDFKLNADSEKGLLIGSITYQGRYSAYQVLYRSDDGKTVGHVQTGEGVVLIPYFPKGDFGVIGQKGDLFAIELPPGEYTFNSWRISSGNATVTPVNDFDIGFEIRPGSALYMGNFNFRQTHGLGLTVTGAVVTYSDQFDRDMDLFKKKYENLEVENIYKGLEDNFAAEMLGGSDRTRFDMPPIFILTN